MKRAPRNYDDLPISVIVRVGVPTGHYQVRVWRNSDGEDEDYLVYRSSKKMRDMGHDVEIWVKR